MKCSFAVGVLNVDSVFALVVISSSYLIYNVFS